MTSGPATGEIRCLTSRVHWLRIGPLLAALCLAGCSSLMTAQSAAVSAAPGTTACRSGGPAGIVRTRVPGHPFEAVASPDGCWIFVSLVSPNPNPVIGTSGGGIGVLQWTGAQLVLKRVVPLSPPRPGGMALSHDGRLLVVADGRYVDFLSVAGLINGADDPQLGLIRDAEAPGSVYVAISRDDRTLFVSNEEVSTVTVIDLRRARRDGFRQDDIVGDISTGRAPVGLAFSRGGRYLFITSEAWPGRPGWPIDCRLRGFRRVGAGAVEVVNVARARERPLEAVVGRTPAGCSPVRAVLSPNGARLYVSARASNAVLVFDAERLETDPAHALVATVPVGAAPVGLEAVAHGAMIVVADSSRFGGRGGEDLTVIDASKINDGAAAVIGTIAAGRFPRELQAMPGGRGLLLTDYGSGQIELIPVAHLAQLARPLHRRTP